MLQFVIGFCVAIAAMVVIRARFGFAAQRVEDYPSGRPIDIRTDLNGTLLCSGVIYGPFGRVASRFFGKFNASWNGNSGEMNEEFQYDSGATQLRHWDLKVDEEGAVTATAPDVIGTATGRQAGSAIVLNYRIKLTEDAGGHVLSVTDWMYTSPSGELVNRSQFRKFGIKVGELVATMRRV
jgi:hypothetical protein